MDLPSIFLTGLFCDTKIFEILLHDNLSCKMKDYIHHDVEGSLSTWIYMIKFACSESHR